MSQRIYYEVDGKVNGPVTLIQLQLMAAAGTLQPHNRVRKEDSQDWHPARSGKGVFTPSPALPTAAPTPKPAPMTSEGENLPVLSAEDVIDEPAPPPPAPTRTPVPARSADPKPAPKPEPKPEAPAKSDSGTSAPAIAEVAGQAVELLPGDT